MIVCNCKAASDRDVHSAIQRGAESLGDLKRCGIGGDCGSCHNLLRAMIHAAPSCSSATRLFWSALAEGANAVPQPETQW
jgi:bacterioferritin-associated ferredoxin